MTDDDINRGALERWRKKLSFLLAEEAKASDPGKLFTLQEEIEEARAKIAELSPPPGFDGGKDDVKWKNLCRQIRQRKFVPILGPNLSERAHPTFDVLARRIADDYAFPLAQRQRADLPRVLQYVGTEEGETAVLGELEDQLRAAVRERHDLPDAPLPKAPLLALLDTVGKRCRQDPDDPHRILAGLPAEVYVTANVDDLLGAALRDAGRTPERLFCTWRDNPPSAPVLADDATVERPAVYHILGVLDEGASLVLTEDDHFDYLMAAARHDLVPDNVASVLGDSSLLFLGFQLHAWSFRVLFRLILSFEGQRLRKYPHVAVQVDPADHEWEDVEGARRYLANYFSDVARIDIYRGTAEEFLVRLREEREKYDES